MVSIGENLDVKNSRDPDSIIIVYFNQASGFTYQSGLRDHSFITFSKQGNFFILQFQKYLEVEKMFFAITLSIYYVILFLTDPLPPPCNTA